MYSESFAHSLVDKLGPVLSVHLYRSVRCCAFHCEIQYHVTFPEKYPYNRGRNVEITIIHSPWHGPNLKDLLLLQTPTVKAFVLIFITQNCIMKDISHQNYFVFYGHSFLTQYLNNHFVMSWWNKPMFCWVTSAYFSIRGFKTEEVNNLIYFSRTQFTQYIFYSNLLCGNIKLDRYTIIQAVLVNSSRYWQNYK